MNPPKLRRKLAQEILLALQACSPMTIEVLQRVVGDGVSKSDLRQALRILKNKGEVEMVVGDHHTFFYQISQALPIRLKLAERLGLAPDEIIQPLLRRPDWFHNQWSNLWQHVVKNAFPSAKFVREHDAADSEFALEALLVSERDMDVLPDFLVHFEKTASTEQVTIAFEIERTRKSEKRLTRKFKKYLDETRIDGLVYICDSSRLSETLRLLYEKKLLTGTRRVRHYAENFVLFSDAMSAGPATLDRFFNAASKPTSLPSWINTLVTTTHVERRDALF